MTDPTETLAPSEGRSIRVRVTEPGADARRTVAGVITQELREHADDRHERLVFETPGVLEGFNDALDELEALKRAM